jgi:DNA-3-methyladenine glycosylase II
MSAIIRSLDDIAAGLTALAGQDPLIARLCDICDLPPLRRSEGGFAALVSIIVSQQVSVASGRAIEARTRQALAPLTAERLMAATDDEYRAGGLSAPKIRAMRALAQAVAAGLDLEGLALRPADEAHAALTAVKGIGPWTADIYLMFCLGHADAFAAGDLALQEALKLALDLPERPAPAALLAHAERWRPWRGVAARLLWAYYAHRKAGREGAPG